VDPPHYFLELTAPQLETLKFVVELRLTSLRGTEDAVLAHFRGELGEVAALLREAPTRITGLAGFARQGMFGNRGTKE
jgi:hypothetical protein